jgi:arylsulfatase A-like enzyme
MYFHFCKNEYKTMFISWIRHSTFCLITLIAVFFCSCLPKDFGRPNIILIMADDLGYGDIGCYGNDKINTPALDKLASEGLRFTDYHSNGSVCSPTRAALLTGRYQQRSGLEGVIYADGESRQTGLDVDELTIADYLKSVGYSTGIIGKWHLGYKIEYNPVYQGFDFFRGFVSGNVDYHSHVDNSGVPDWWFNLEKVEENGYATDLITKHALEFMEKNRDKPFFLYVPQAAPHAPFQGRNDAADRFPGTRFSYEGSAKNKQITFQEMIETMDEGIGKIMQKVDELGIRDNTLIIFCSDNGGYQGYSDNGELRGFKGSLWEGGHRVPCIMRWPEYIKPGTVSDETVMSMDFFPTFIHLSKSTPEPGIQLDGIDITELLIDQSELPDRTICWRYKDQNVVRNGKWKLLVDKDTTFLFDLSNDLKEQVNVITSQASVADQLGTELDAWKTDVMQGVRLKTN